MRRRDNLELIRSFNDRRVLPLKTASQLAIEGASCGNCGYRPAMTCMLKRKVVKFYSICAEWKE